LLVFDVGNIICLVGTILSIIAVIRDRDVLRGYSLLGSSLTATAMVFFLIGFIQLKSIVSVVSCTITTLYWLLVTSYLLIRRFK